MPQRPAPSRKPWALGLCLTTEQGPTTPTLDAKNACSLGPTAGKGLQTASFAYTVAQHEPQL